MAAKNTFENSLKIMRISLLVSGIKTYSIPWNNVTEVFVNSCLYIVNFITLYTVLFGEVAWLIEGIQIGKSFIVLSHSIPLITITVLSTVKSFYLYINRNIVCEVIDTLKEIHPETAFNEPCTGNQDKILFRTYNEGGLMHCGDEKSLDSNVEDKLTKEAVMILKVVVSLLVVVSGSVLVMFLLAPLVLMVFEYISEGETKVLFPFAVVYWFDVYATKWWPVLYLHQVIATIIVCMNLFAADILYYVICTYLQMHFRILCHRLESAKPVSPRISKEYLIQCVRRHQLLIYLVDQAEVLFSKSALFHIVSSSLLICLSAFNITVTEDIKTLFAFVSFLSLSLSQVSLLCFFGDKLMESSQEVSGAAYKCPWYDFQVKTKKAILIIIMRAQKPCKLTAANFADLNLRAFTTILSRSWSYFALLKTVYK